MEQAFYTAAVGAAQQQKRLNVQGNNIANINTQGFKAERTSFASLMYRDVPGIDNAELPVGTGSEMVLANTDFSAGALMITNRVQDYAIQGKGFFALIDSQNGEISYTRDGAFVASVVNLNTGADDGAETVTYLTDGDGRFVLNSMEERIRVLDPMQKQPVGVFDFANTNGMLHADSSRFVPIAKNGAARVVDDAKVITGALEASNSADLGREMTQVIEAQRSFSYALKMVQVSDEITATVNGLRD